MGKTKVEIRKEVKVNGRDLVVFLNADRGVCENTDIETLHFLREHLSGEWDCKGRPIVFTDEGTRLYIQAKEGRGDALSVHKTVGSGSGSKGSSKCPPAVLEFLLKQADKEKYPEEIRAWLDTIVPDYPDVVFKAAKLMHKDPKDVKQAEIDQMKALGILQ